MRSYSGTIDAAKESILKGIIDSIKFGTDPQTAENESVSTTENESVPTTENESVPTAEFQYNDSKTGASFTVPANWTESPLDEEREAIDVEFTSNAADGMFILYGSTDLWAEATTSERAELTRADIDNSIFTKESVAEAYGISASDVSVVSYNGNEYYCAEVTNDDPSTPVTITLMCRAENGYMYVFQFSGNDSNEYYNDFETLLNSVKYENYNAATDISDNNTASTSDLSAGNIIISLLVTISVYSLPIILYRYAIRKAPVEKRKAKKITIIYGIAAFIVMSILIFMINGSGAAGGAIILWSYINYRVLISGKSETTETHPQDGSSDNSLTEIQGEVS